MNIPSEWFWAVLKGVFGVLAAAVSVLGGWVIHETRSRRQQVESLDRIVSKVGVLQEATQRELQSHAQLDETAHMRVDTRLERMEDKIDRLLAR